MIPIGNNGADLVQKSGIPGAIIMPQNQHYFLKEQAFTQSQRYSFGAAEIKYFLIDPTAYAPGPTQELGRIISEVPSFFAASGPVEVDFLELTTLAPAVATTLTLPAFNRVSGSAITAQLVLSSLDVAPGAASEFSEILVPSNATGSGQQVGFSVSEELPFILDLTKKLVMRVKNLDGADTLVGIRWTWFEV
jgi:hypothetical protein